MQLSQMPVRVSVRWASAAGGSYTRQVPNTQGSPGDGSASFSLGFPPETFVPVAAGGIPPSGKDENGILNQLSGWAQWMAAGGAAQFNSAFAAAVGGYPKYSILASTTPGKLWQSTVDNNTTDPDGGSAANWQLIVGAPSSGTNSNGTWRQQSDGFIQQWGQFTISPNGSSTANASVTFPIPFVNPPLIVLPVALNPGRNDWNPITLLNTGRSTNGASFNIDTTENGKPFQQSVTVRYKAEGY